MGCIFMMMDSVPDSKLADPKMTTENNPLSRPATSEDVIKKFNMKKLMADAERRDCPYNGHVYRAVMDMRYKEE